ncbi:HET domain protein [Aspergillus campestris IBT 28561]|uniref:HET domain protein n=1 Tax=Aspergillus campestris (strain IBT 28561) TaxID=1392248 RepID=A0A2I1CRF4_ASPC2|nr:HET domain protein [Aspergillus campestris IBT 28561]PKY00211.1 HET domain protein [Aspergillus campestris IBT 28561]
MRLLHSKTLDLHEFLDDSIPPYAVFSHRWQEGEVLLRDIESGTAREKKGFGKVESCCAEAASRGLEYVWIDTLCIDKSSSAELSESLNSMYEWYHKSAVCLAYLVDVTQTSVTSDGEFQRSVWFTRGWTLQELLAPVAVEFFNTAWRPLGTKATLKTEISEITGIHEDVLLGTVQPQSFSVAQRMSWAAGRTTTKVEDIAYSLIGLFDVNMPMLYGEGPKAFMRLQEEIMKQSDDQTLFAWSSKDDNYRGLLARSPADFAGSSHFIVSTDKVNASPYSMTNMGLSIELSMVQWGMEVYLAALDCQDHTRQRLGIYLTPLREPNQYGRVMLDEIDLPRFSSNGSSRRRRIYVRQNMSREGKPPSRLYGFWLRHIPPPETGPNARWEFTAWSSWNDRDRIVSLPPGAYGTAAVIRYRPKGGNVVNLKLGFDANFNPACQYGGHILGPRARNARDPRAFDTVMLSDWMDPPALEGVHVGDRLRGVNGDDGWYRVVMLDEIVQGKRMWVVYIASVDDAYWHPGRLCDGCGLEIFGPRYICKTCEGFDYCSNCHQGAAETHPSHSFKEIRLGQHDGVRCDYCGDVRFHQNH